MFHFAASRVCALRYS